MQSNCVLLSDNTPPFFYCGRAYKVCLYVREEIMVICIKMNSQWYLVVSNLQTYILVLCVLSSHPPPCVKLELCIIMHPRTLHNIWQVCVAFFCKCNNLLVHNFQEISPVFQVSKTMAGWLTPKETPAWRANQMAGSLWEWHQDLNNNNDFFFWSYTVTSYGVICLSPAPACTEHIHHVFISATFCVLSAGMQPPLAGSG